MKGSDISDLMTNTVNTHDAPTDVYLTIKDQVGRTGQVRYIREDLAETNLDAVIKNHRRYEGIRLACTTTFDGELRLAMPLTVKGLHCKIGEDNKPDLFDEQVDRALSEQIAWSDIEEN